MSYELFILPAHVNVTFPCYAVSYGQFFSFSFFYAPLFPFATQICSHCRGTPSLFKNADGLCPPFCTHAHERDKRCGYTRGGGSGLASAQLRLSGGKHAYCGGRIVNTALPGVQRDYRVEAFFFPQGKFPFPKQARSLHVPPFAAAFWNISTHEPGGGGRFEEDEKSGINCQKGVGIFENTCMR